ncbi:GGDEF domain-containing protein [Marinobacter salsuginis]|uniref:diguanylate cyclase n=1 Tax=Marinobacter salsuginis TaxID=418719 RepID=A0A5M3PP35_9GAMM|nr:GGDEF domain-containing protein [Marinobacter salsuginis]GBO84712.1 GGDEF domain-containing protein [Marinobacter salsuginis]
MKSAIPSLNLPAAPEAGGISEVTPAEGLRAVLDNLDALVYVSDLETHDLLYMNAYGRKIWGSIDGRKCWEVLQDSASPCDFCTNHLLIDAEGTPSPPHIWEFQNRLDQRWYQCRDQAIPWIDGRLVRLEIATDITERKEMELALKEAHEKARAAALEDDLTGLRNRRAFFELGNQLLKQSRRSGSPLAIIMFDLDYFKKINDNHGHEAGDEVLRHIGQLLESNVREADIAARIGGEEFAILLADAHAVQASELAERLLELMQKTPVRYRDVRIRPTASFGISALHPEEPDLKNLLARADNAMYQSKALGRGRVRIKP